ncbi:MAG: TIGR01777 family oxidoreductase [Bacteroidia bacterium]|nr:TIGR01777 family oxidoreductase [Bacteroidia bacterium]
MAKILIAGGSGLIGRKLSRLLQENGHEVMWLSRSSRPAAYRSFLWNPANREIDPAAIAEAEVVVSLAGSGIADKAWTSAYKDEILRSRLDAAATLIHALQHTPHRVRCIVAASAIGIYGNRGEEWLSEDSGAGTGFLSETVMQWEKAYAGLAIRTVVLRTGIVLAKDGGALPVMATPLKAGICPVTGSGNQFMSWIHVEDLCRMFRYAMEEENLSGIYNAVGPSPLPHREFMKILRSTIAPRSLMLPVPAALLRLLLGEKSALVLDSARVSSGKIQQTGFRFQFTRAEDALKNIYAS